MADITVKRDPETGAATIELRGATVNEPKFRLRDINTEKYLTRRGWSKSPAYLPGEAITAADFTVLVLDAELARRINVGTSVSLEQPASNIFATIDWPEIGAAGETSVEEPESTVVPTVAPLPIAEAAEATPSAPDTTSDVPDEMAAAAEQDAARLKEETAAKVEPEAEEPAQASLEPSSKEEAAAAPEAPAVAPEPERKYRPLIEDEEEEEPGPSWGRLAAAAVFFMLLGAVLAYFWQSSAYDNELRTAMRAVESQREQQKVDFEQRLAQAELAATDGAPVSGDVAEITRDRDAALKEVSDQQAKVKELEERLLKAQGDNERLKVAAEVDATEQTALLNRRINELDKELETARSELAAGTKELALREEALAKSDAERKASTDELAALKTSIEDQQAGQSEEAQSRIASLSAELDKATQDLAARDASLREAQSQLAGQTGEGNDERKTLADRITALTEQLDKADGDLAAREAELKSTRTSLETANALAQSNADELDRLKSASVANTSSKGNGEDERARLKQERDLFAADLKAMTKSFNDLKAERDRIAAALDKSQLASLDDNAAATDGASATDRGGVWGATAIDQTGAVYSLQNQTSEKAAREKAIALCRSRSSGRCEPLQTYQKSCFSLARIEGEGPRNDNFGYSVGRDIRTAEAAAKRECQQLGGDCTIRFTACSPNALSTEAANQ